jgi:hypothetical protein
VNKREFCSFSFLCQSYVIVVRISKSGVRVDKDIRIARLIGNVDRAFGLVGRGD